MSRLVFLLSICLPLCLLADSIPQMKLAPYKEFLEWGTYHSQDWSSLNHLPKSRYDTFLYAFEYFEANQGLVIVELGTSRSFTHGGHPGCNSDDPTYWKPDQPEIWDWGAGFFTRMAAMSLHHLNPQFHTVDIISSHIERCKLMTADFADIIIYHRANSLDYLNHAEFPNGIDLIYLDTGDMTPIEPTALLQMEEAKIIVKRNLLSKNGIILIDDVKNRTPKKFGETSDFGKSKYSIPYLLEHGFEIIADEYQVILRKQK